MRLCRRFAGRVARPASGMLHAGALGHLLAEDMEAVFLLGLNDGILSRDTESLLTPGGTRPYPVGYGLFPGPDGRKVGRCLPSWT